MGAGGGLSGTATEAKRDENDGVLAGEYRTATLEAATGSPARARFVAGGTGAKILTTGIASIIAFSLSSATLPRPSSR
jgi:hypothetical protein